MIVYYFNNTCNLNICTSLFKDESHWMDKIHGKLFFSIVV